MADFEVKITPRSGLSAFESIARRLDRLARRQQILEHLAQSRRARLSSNIDDRSAAERARTQRRLETRRRESAASQTTNVEATRPADDEPSAKPATDTRKSTPDAQAPGDASFVQEWRDSLARLKELNASDTPFAGQEIAAQAAARRTVRVQSQAATTGTSAQNEIARLQARPSAETQRADLVVALIENVLSASTARIIQHQARLEAMQAQINALQGR